jgi:hypothetical protein
MAKFTYLGSAKDTDPIYNQGWTISAGVRLSPALVKTLKKRESALHEKPRKMNSEHTNLNFNFKENGS